MSSTAQRYERFARFEAGGSSEVYEQWTAAISRDPEVLELIDGLPEDKRQPNLVLASARSCGAAAGPYPQFRSFLQERWEEIRPVILRRSTQTNEPRRCAVLLPLLAEIARTEERPLALIEVGASAGLCLYPDRYGYRYDDGDLINDPGRPDLVLDCITTGNPPLPRSCPEIISRAGVDLAPLDPADPRDLAWLDALIWPGMEDRRALLQAAAGAAAKSPARIIKGDLNAEIAGLIEAAPAEAAVVVFHTAVLAYVPKAGREAFRETMSGYTSGRPVHWISNEGSGAIPGLAAPAGDPGLFVLHHNGTAVARTGPHGQSLHWLQRVLP
ncbi:DUF2332 domain-containing protein [Arthrobacter sp. zg-Y769]|uniref:DUF2332 domain-containing protein n=1 Tax=Arthrobacter sp. zg-Y769 TaxID=2894191 RepID=UPI001E5817C3|nr:DUF2332 domain-containing protein [Arthrobacter sp. zg-Y769]MCC9204003.1 DUF2332 domain-containing protein [Arthrobacter sp. zg-Y769]